MQSFTVSTTHALGCSALNLVVTELSRCPLIVLGLGVIRDSRDLLLREQSEKLPSLVQGVEDGPVLVEGLLDELALEPVVKLQVVVVLLRQGVLTDDGLHGLSILALGVEGVHLGSDLWVIWSGHTLADSMLHETGQGWQDVDWWVDASPEHVSVDVDLALRDVAGQVGDGMSDVVVGHGQDGQLSDGAFLASDTTGTLVDGGQIGVHVTWVASTTRHLLSGGGDLTQGVGV